MLVSPVFTAIVITCRKMVVVVEGGGVLSLIKKKKKKRKKSELVHTVVDESENTISRRERMGGEGEQGGVQETNKLQTDTGRPKVFWLSVIMTKFHICVDC